jgi:murein DD-endopeptidase MepM/ murein hydrolase activator NlpD
MNVIFVGKRHGKSRAIALNGPLLLVVGLVLLALVAAGGWGGYTMAVAKVQASQPSESELVAQWRARLAEQQAQVDQARELVQAQIDALTLRVGRLQGRLLRLDALGQRFVESGMVASDEFNFDLPAAVGGPEEGVMGGESYSVPELESILQRLESQIRDRETQLRLLDDFASREKIEDERYVEGRPITWGWLSSKYGYRTDPFTGKRAWHAGVDLAGKEGSDIIAVAGGVVTHAGDQYGYGNLVEIDHGNGLITRYAHCKTVKVEVGDVVEKGQVVALMGSTGRSTGPHVHFEVIRNGKTEDPVKYIQRAAR